MVKELVGGVGFVVFVVGYHCPGDGQTKTSGEVTEFSGVFGGDHGCGGKEFTQAR